MERKFHMHDGKMGAAITVRIIPRSSHDKISEVLEDGTIKICLTAPQTEEKANQALIDFLAEVLSVDADRLEIVAGLSGTDKLVTIEGLGGDTVHALIMQRLA
jgi:uncharacterized protein (TIGR00251 family)